MPEIKDIDKLKQQLNSFGDEPAILQELGEEIEDIQPTPQELPDDISALLGDMDQSEDVLDDFFGTEAVNLDEGADTLFDQMADDGTDADAFTEPEAVEEAEEDADAEPEPEAFDELPEAFDELPEDLPEEAMDFGDLDDFTFDSGGIEAEPEDASADDELPAEELPEELPEEPEPEAFDEMPEDLPDEAMDFGDISWDEDISAEDDSEDLDSGIETDADAEEEPEPFEDLPSEEMPEDLPAEELPEELSEEPEPEEPEPEEFDIGDLENISMDDDFDESDEKSAAADTDIDTEDFGALEDLGEDGELELTGAPAEGSDEFSLEDLGEEFGSIDDLDDIPIGDASEPELRAAPEAAGLEETAGSLELYITADKLSKVTHTLNNLPRNLKLYIEDLIGNKGLSGEPLDQLVDKLASGASVKEITSTIFHITGKRIRIPAQYERKTWEDLEKEKGTLAYVLRYKILPLTGKILAYSFIGLFIFFIIKTFIWEPVYSSYLYRKGFDYLISEQFGESEKLFLKAGRIKAQRKQFYKYSEAYRDKKEYAYAEKKYVQLLGISLTAEREKPKNDREQGYFPGDKKGFLDYSFLKTYYQGDFASSEAIIDDFLYLRGNKWDYEMLVYKIDNYLNWAAVKDRSKYVDAETEINDSLFKFGSKPELFFRKIAVDIRTGKLSELREEALASMPVERGLSQEKRIYLGVLGQYRGFIEGIKEKNSDPYIASDFYKYIIDTGDVEGISSSLLNVIDLDRNLPEPYFQLSRVFKVVEDPDNERKSLEAFEMALAQSSTDYLRENYPHSYEYGKMMRKKYEVTGLNRLGYFHYRDENILPAQRYYQKAISEYENNRSLIGAGPAYGYLYEDLGNIYYYNAGRFGEALEQFKKAAATGYNDDNLLYKIGYIYYRDKNYSEALEKFYDVLLNRRDNISVLTAFANASFNSGVYSPARAYLEQVKEKLEYWREIEGYIDIENRRDHRAVLDKLMQVYNNLGVSLYMLAERGRNVNYYSNALVYFTKSAELYDLMSRDPETLLRSITSPLAQINMRYALMNAGSTAGNAMPPSDSGMLLDGPVIYNILDLDLSGRVEMITAME